MRRQAHGSTGRVMAMCNVFAGFVPWAHVSAQRCTQRRHCAQPAAPPTKRGAQGFLGTSLERLVPDRPFGRDSVSWHDGSEIRRGHGPRSG
jgi:hypothetical protein